MTGDERTETVVRAFQLRQAVAIYAAYHRDDDLHLAVRYGGRFLCIEFRRQDADFLIFDKNLLTAEPAGLSYTKPSEVYFCGKKM